MKHTEKKPYVIPEGIMLLLNLSTNIDVSTGGFLGDIDIFVEKAPEESDAEKI